MPALFFILFVCVSALILAAAHWLKLYLKKSRVLKHSHKLTREGKHIEAAYYLTKFVESNSAPEALVLRGRIQMLLKNYRAALEDFDQAILLEHSEAEAYRYKGEILFRLGYFVEAEQNLSLSLCYKESPEAYRYRGYIRWKQGSWFNAQSDLEAATSLGDEDANYYLHMHAANTYGHRRKE